MAEQAKAEEARIKLSRGLGGRRPPAELPPFLRTMSGT